VELVGRLVTSALLAGTFLIKGVYLMGPDIKERVRRESEYFDQRQFQRTGFEEALSYLNNGIGRQRRNEVVREAMQLASCFRSSARR
jgi:hypothetical protein